MFLSEVVLDVLEHRLVPMLHGTAEEVLFAVEVVIDGALGHARFRRHLLQPSRSVPARPEDTKRSVQQCGGRRSQVVLRARRTFSGHTHE